MAAAVSGGGHPPHGRYYAELVPTSPETGLQATVQELLDAGERKEWHLVGVAGGLPEGACSFLGYRASRLWEEPVSVGPGQCGLQHRTAPNFRPLCTSRTPAARPRVTSCSSWASGTLVEALF